MKTDIFENMKDYIGCNDVSDLPYRKREVWEEIKRQIPLQYPRTVRKVFSLCVWCRLCCYNGNTGYDERK